MHQKYRNRIKTLGAVVPAKIYELAQEQARIESVTVSHLLGKLLVKHLRKQGTSLMA